MKLREIEFCLCLKCSFILSVRKIITSKSLKGTNRLQSRLCKIHFIWQICIFQYFNADVLPWGKTHTKYPPDNGGWTDFLLKGDWAKIFSNMRYIFKKVFELWLVTVLYEAWFLFLQFWFCVLILLRPLHMNKFE